MRYFSVLYKKNHETMSWHSLFSRLNSFQKTALFALFVTFLLIFIGGLVRATGAGLGCPDWPRCFGLWIPPLSAAELPPGYDPDAFNVFKTWMEYVNRLAGVVVGFSILLMFFTSFRYLTVRPSVFLGSAGALLLVLFQGWLGGQVVISGLEGWMISAHMVVAVIILNLILWTFFRSVREKVRLTLGRKIRGKLILIVTLLLVVTIVQIVLGTQVREALEMIKAGYPALDRGMWMDQVGLIDAIHRSFSWVVLALVLYLQYLVWSNSVGPYLPLLAGLITTTTILQIVFGVGLVYFGIPPVFQVLHLWFATLMTVIPFLALLFVITARKGVSG